MPLSAAGKGWDAAAAKEVKKLVGRQMLPRKINDLNFFGCQSASTAPNSAKGDVCQNPFNVLILLCNFLAAPVRTVHYILPTGHASRLRMSLRMRPHQNSLGGPKRPVESGNSTQRRESVTAHLPGFETPAVLRGSCIPACPGDRSSPSTIAARQESAIAGGHENGADPGGKDRRRGVL